MNRDVKELGRRWARLIFKDLSVLPYRYCLKICQHPVTCFEVDLGQVQSLSDQNCNALVRVYFPSSIIFLLPIFFGQDF